MYWITQATFCGSVKLFWKIRQTFHELLATFVINW